MNLLLRRHPTEEQDIAMRSDLAEDLQGRPDEGACCSGAPSKVK